MTDIDISYVPLQNMPLPSKPVLQVHSKLPGVLVQSALTLQTSVKHSLISGDYEAKVIYKNCSLQCMYKKDTKQKFYTTYVCTNKIIDIEQNYYMCSYTTYLCILDHFLDSHFYRYTGNYL